MKVVLGAIAAAVLAGALFAQPAEARCFWNGYAMECYRSTFMHPWRYDRPHFHMYRDWY